MRRAVFILICFFSFIAFIFPDTVQEKVISEARTLIGVPYRIGGVSPSGFDCSGLITYLYKVHVPDLPRVSRDMARSGMPVERNSLLPGDLVFFSTGLSPRRVTHVALYIGQNSIIHSISNGPERGVTISSLNARYWRSRYHNSSRILEIKSAESADRAENMIFAKGIYNGSLKNGEPDGQGILLMKNGDRYKGNFENGLFHGKGTYIWADGRTFEGEFTEGSFAGKGVMVVNGGDRVSGEWENGIFTADNPVITASDSTRDKNAPAEEKSGKADLKPEKQKSTAAPSGALEDEAVKTASADDRDIQEVPGDKGSKDRLSFKSDNYFQQEDSPWSTFDGIVEGDFDLWYKKDMEKFEEWKKTH